MRKYKEANEVVTKITRGITDRSNLHEANKLQQLVEEKTVEKDSTEKITTKNEYGMADLMKTKSIRRKSLILFYCWLTASIIYYGLTMNASDLGGDPYVNLLLSGIIEVPACVGSIFFMDRLGRRPTLSIAYWIAGISCICMQFVKKDQMALNIFLSLIGKFGGSSAFASSYIYASELYATPIRNVGIGTCSTMARIGGILAPFIAMLGDLSAPLPYVVFGGISMVAGVLSLLLPETLGAKMPETIEECANFGSNQVNPLKRIFCCKKQGGSDNDYLQCDSNDEKDDEKI